MRVTIQISANRKNGPSTAGEITVTQDRRWVVLALDSTGGGINDYSMRPADALVLARAIEQAAVLAEACGA